ncbi:MAG: hypothetical protein B6D41_16070 [Chloroflexi bacterium UTCFX4]|nr:MAG: hypothetical protein B6D41_16070 [Chloroflexi bacterium UTCFX4]
MILEYIRKNTRAVSASAPEFPRAVSIYRVRALMLKRIRALQPSIYRVEAHLFLCHAICNEVRKGTLNCCHSEPMTLRDFISRQTTRMQFQIGMTS